jgi:sterol desaturase/sphingolipid hydroxylase (fatty acid hydroxylase superfamily)
MATENATNALGTVFLVMFQDPSNRWFALYLLSSLCIAFAVYKYQARRDSEMKADGFLAFAFPAEVYNHRSAKVDYLYFIINKLLFGVLLAEVVIGSQLFSGYAEALCAKLGVFTFNPGNTAIWTAVTSAAFLLAADFGLWLGHYLLHRIPLLWEFHKVHHSAEVLTPFSAGRVHPVDDLLTYAFAGAFGGTARGICTHLFGNEAVVLSAAQLSMVFFAFYVLGFHLRHSHVWLPYPVWLGRVLISPAHHQVHHSSARRHWDRNMGFIFAFWDWIFGTLYVPAQKREEFPLGLGGEETQYSSVLRLYWLPFQKARRLLLCKLKRSKNLSRA